MRQAEIWWMETPNDKRRPVLIVTRTSAIPMLSTILVAPITSTLRHIPTALPVGTDEGLDHESAAMFDAIASVPKSKLTRKLGSLGADGIHRVCQCLHAAADC